MRSYYTPLLLDFSVLPLLSLYVAVFVQFNELSKGKAFIPIKTLRNWDELQGLVEAELITQDVLESYFVRLDVRDSKVDLRAFQAFVGMLDTVLVDEQGSVLGMDDDFSGAVDLSGMDEDELD